MKSSTFLHSAVFHLTPTRTRCDLIITANGKQEKIASGLLNPFVAHLKTAQDQIAKGGYSIVLEPQTNSWFTKGTLERFVRFVSTPEILERVYSIESEILQIEEAIVVQGKNDLDYTDVNDSQGKPSGTEHGSKLVPDQPNEEKAIILYEPVGQQPESDQKVPPEGNSRVQLLKVLETRKNVLKKEQGMAFARAVAAGFDLDHMAPLQLFAECFGAKRLMDASESFMDLWKRKHDNGQWLEIDTPEPALSGSEYLAMSSSDIMLASVANKHQDSQSNNAQNQHLQAQLPHPMFSPWPIPSYSVQGMPYYINYPGNGPYYHPHYPATTDSHYVGGHKTGKRRQSVEGKDSDSESATSNSLETPEFTTGKRKSGLVVIRNINYIASEAKATSTGSGSGSGSESEQSCDEDHTSPYKTSNKKDMYDGLVNESSMNNREDTSNGKDNDAGHWQAFQGFLLEGADEENLSKKDTMKMLRCQSPVENDDPNNWSNDKIHEISGKFPPGNIGLNDDFLLSGGSNDGGRSQSDRGNLEDPLTGNGFDNGTLSKESKKEMGDESFMVPFRSLSLDEVRRDGRTIIDMDAEFPSSHGKNDDISNYEPDALSVMPERVIEGRPSEYNPTLEYDMQVSVEDKRRKDNINVKEVSKKSAKKRTVGGLMKKEKSSRMNLLEDARARAEKLRSFKADIQKIKKEKEEADKKRIEVLKLERQKRIAARANPISAMQTRKLPSKLSPISNGGSKFSDKEPGASSPLQRSKTRTISLGSLRNNDMEGNRLTRSVSSLSDSRKEGSKASMARIRRLSEPKASSKPGPVVKKKLSNGPDIKKISAIMNLDKSKAATLPELKIKAIISQKSNGAKSSSISLDAGSRLNNENRSHNDDVDDNPIIDKTVVMLEYEKPSISLSHQDGEKKSIQTQSKVRAPPTPMDIANKSPTPTHLPVQTNSKQVTFDMHNGASSTSEEPYRAPYARNSSLEEPPVYSDMGSTVKENGKAFVTDVKTNRVDVVPEAMDKTQVRESSKGFRRLLKFGKKSHTSTGDQSVNLDNSSVKSFEFDDEKTIAGSSSEVFTIKNLIAQDESPSGSASQKLSRHFSLFAPFRGKSSEKKVTA